jgi:hypothetical protein
MYNLGKSFLPVNSLKKISPLAAGNKIDTAADLQPGLVLDTIKKMHPPMENIRIHSNTASAK